MWCISCFSYFPSNYSSFQTLRFYTFGNFRIGYLGLVSDLVGFICAINSSYSCLKDSEVLYSESFKIMRQFWDGTNFLVHMPAWLFCEKIPKYFFIFELSLTAQTIDANDTYPSAALKETTISNFRIWIINIQGFNLQFHREDTQAKEN